MESLEQYWANDERWKVGSIDRWKVGVIKRRDQKAEVLEYPVGGCIVAVGLVSSFCAKVLPTRA
jgi:hypothetical protein